LSNLATFLRGVPDAVIANMNRHQRLVVTQFLTEQIRRYTPTEDIKYPYMHIYIALRIVGTYSSRHGSAILRFRSEAPKLTLQR
jgi:hypothetical protein